MTSREKEHPRDASAATSELLALGLSRYAARPRMDHTEMTRLVPGQDISDEILDSGRLEVPPETVLSVTRGLLNRES
jgi:hypothetical protein